MNKSCKEIKRFLLGKEVIYNCELVAFCGGFGILRYTFNRQQRVGSLTLRPGMVSYGFYWTNRPYNLYSWFDKSGNPIGYYFNLADSVNLSCQKFVWRDLVVDILVSPTGAVEVLDEKDLPLSLDGKIKDYINRGKELVLRNYKEIIQEVNAMLSKYVYSVGENRNK